MPSRKEEVLRYLNQFGKKISASEVGDALQMDRANASRYLNDLFKEHRIEKLSGKPVLYQALQTE